MRDANLPINTAQTPGKKKKRTDVLKENVSRETILAGGNVRAMYVLFRKDGMRRFESLYNAVYLASHNKYNNSAVLPKNEYNQGVV